MKIILTFQAGEKVTIDQDGALHSDSEPARQIVELYMRLVPEATNLPHPWEPAARIATQINGGTYEIVGAVMEDVPGEIPRIY